MNVAYVSFIHKGNYIPMKVNKQPFLYLGEVKEDGVERICFIEKCRRTTPCAACLHVASERCQFVSGMTRSDFQFPVRRDGFKC